MLRYDMKGIVAMTLHITDKSALPESYYEMEAAFIDNILIPRQV
ncbi:hypothetical protein [uncultured Mucilaginibacter sp.]|nr:hypothetical protein [uncultured Mucilaginibacter sp.]